MAKRKLVEDSDIEAFSNNKMPQFYVHWSDYASILIGVFLFACYGKSDDILYLLVGLSCLSSLFAEIKAHITSWLLSLGSVLIYFVLPNEINAFEDLSLFKHTGFLLGMGFFISAFLSFSKKLTFGIMTSGYIISYGLLIIGCMFYANNLMTLPTLMIGLTSANLVINTAAAVVKSSFILYC